MGPKPKITEQFGHCGSGQDEVCAGQHGQEYKHGLVEALLCCNQVEENAVAYDSHNINDTKGNPDPGVEPFQAGYANESEGSWVVTAEVIHGLRGICWFLSLRTKILSESFMKGKCLTLGAEVW